MRPTPAMRPALAALLALLAGCQEKQAEAPPRRERPVLVAQVRYEPAVPERSFVGTVRPRVESDHGFRVPGRVARRLVDVGDPVKVGQPLAVLDDTDLRLQLEQAEAELRAGRSAQATAEAEQRRAEALRERGFGTDSTAEARRAAAEEARGRVLRAERAVSLARNALGYATLRAEADGTVTAVLVEPGQVVEIAKPAIRVARGGEKEALVALPEAFVERAREGAARVTLWADPSRPYQARLRELAPAADPTTRTYAARFTILDPGEAVRLGMTVTVAVGGRTDERLARLPLAALLDEGQGPAVFVVDRETGGLARRAVEVAAYAAREVTVRAGVAEGDWVVALGAQKLDPAQAVRVVESLSF